MSFGKRELNTRTSLQVIHLNSLTPQLDNNHHINLDAHHAQNLWITLGKVSFQIWPMHIYIYYTFTLWQTQNSYYTVNKVIYITEIDSYHLHCYKQTAAIISYSKKKKKRKSNNFCIMWKTHQLAPLFYIDEDLWNGDINQRYYRHRVFH